MSAIERRFSFAADERRCNADGVVDHVSELPVIRCGSDHGQPLAISALSVFYLRSSVAKRICFYLPICGLDEDRPCIKHLEPQPLNVRCDIDPGATVAVAISARPIVSTLRAVTTVCTCRRNAGTVAVPAMPTMRSWTQPTPPAGSRSTHARYLRMRVRESAHHPADRGRRPIDRRTAAPIRRRRSRARPIPARSPRPASRSRRAARHSDRVFTRPRAATPEPAARAGSKP